MGVQRGEPLWQGVWGLCPQFPKGGWVGIKDICPTGTMPEEKTSASLNSYPSPPHLDSSERPCYHLAMGTPTTSPTAPRPAAPKTAFQSRPNSPKRRRLVTKTAPIPSHFLRASHTKRNRMEHFETLFRGKRPHSSCQRALPTAGGAACRAVGVVLAWRSLHS